MEERSQISEDEKKKKNIESMNAACVAIENIHRNWQWILCEKLIAQPFLITESRKNTQYPNIAILNGPFTINS